MKKHYLHKEMTVADGPVSVVLVGCGGTGSQILTGLARLHYALYKLRHPGLHVSVFDGDNVSEANIARQNFSPLDVGRNKAVVSVTKINQFMGLSWKACPFAFDGARSDDTVRPSILISAVDSARARTVIGRPALWTPLFFCWLDAGKQGERGEVIVGYLKNNPHRPGKAD